MSPTFFMLSITARPLVLGLEQPALLSVLTWLLKVAALAASSAVLLFLLALTLLLISEARAKLAIRRLRTALSSNPLPAVYLKRADVQKVLHFMHFIPMSRGWSQRLVSENYPGWAWNPMVALLTTSGALDLSAPHTEQVTGSWEGILLDGVGGWVFDHGDLQHAAKSSWAEPKSPDTSVVSARPAGMNLATGMQIEKSYTL